MEGPSEIERVSRAVTSLRGPRLGGDPTGVNLTKKHGKWTRELVLKIESIGP